MTARKTKAGLAVDRFSYIVDGNWLRIPGSWLIGSSPYAGSEWKRGFTNRAAVTQRSFGCAAAAHSARIIGRGKGRREMPSAPIVA